MVWLAREAVPLQSSCAAWAARVGSPLNTGSDDKISVRVTTALASAAGDQETFATPAIVTAADPVSGGVELVDVFAAWGRRIRSVLPSLEISTQPAAFRCSTSTTLPSRSNAWMMFS